MNLSGKLALFRLSSDGDRALSGALPPGGSFFGQVVDQDEIGLWVAVEGQEVGVPQVPLRIILLKWDYLATAISEFEPQQPAVRQRIGF